MTVLGSVLTWLSLIAVGFVLGCWHERARWRKTMTMTLTFDRDNAQTVTLPSGADTARDVAAALSGEKP